MNPDATITDDEIRALFEPLLGAPIAIAVSGGADSMALMHMARRALDLVPLSITAIHPDWPRLLVLTVDHGLRAGSADDARWVVSQAEAVGLPSQLLKWTGKKPKQAIQAEARAARYRLMHEALAEEAHPYGDALRVLLSAHHMEDQAETFLMRLARGSGLDGLSAMQREEQLADDELGTLRLHRPLLGLPKSRLIATLGEARLTWREDPSNERTDFERVRVRKTLDTLSELGITPEALARSARRLSRARAAITHEVRVSVEQLVDWHDGSYGSTAHGTMRALPEEIAIRVLARMIAVYGGEASEPRLSEIEGLAERIRAPAERPWPARAATLGGCRIDWRPGGDVRVWREAGRTPLPTASIGPNVRSVVWDGRFRIAAADETDGEVEIRPLDLATWRNLRAELPNLGKLPLPPGAAATLPGCWLGTELLAVPGLPAPTSPLITAEFIGGRGRTAL